MSQSTTKMPGEVASLADHTVQTYAAGKSYLPALAELCARCEAAGLDHKLVLDEAMRRADLPPSA
jgi:hypothetical protein